MNSQPTTKGLTQLREEIIRLGPWHLDVQVTPELSSSAFLDAPDDVRRSWEAHPVVFLDQRERFQRLMKLIYPEGLEGRSFLDCACNCGAYSFWMKEIGAGSSLGFDVRDHWIDQARFLLEHRDEWPRDDMRFELLDLYDLPKLDLESFDVTLFKGIFYHLPDPVAGLKLAADLTREVLIVDTAVRVDLADGMLVLENEDDAHPMSGVYGLNWLPTGPAVMKSILDWMGFKETRLVTWMVNPRQAGRGRLRMIGAREPGRLDRVGSVTELNRQPGPGR